MTAHFALVQQTLEIPEVEKLKRAFRAVRSLTAADAPTIANDAYGILVKNLGADDAVALQGALRDEGIETHMVLQSDLPQLPPIKFLRCADCQPDALMVYDPIGRTIPVPWGHVMLIAAGSVRVIEFRQEIKRPGPADWDYPEVEHFLRDGFMPGLKGFQTPLSATPESTTREIPTFRWLLEIVLTRAAMRFQIEADKFRFTTLGDRATADPGRNLGLLAQEMMKRAPDALVNRGAFHLREDPAGVMSYPSKNAFYEEMTWILWRAAQTTEP